MFSTNILSIDIGNKNIKVIDGKKKDNTIVVKRAFILPTPADSFQDGEIIDIEILSEFIKKSLRENKIRTKKAICTIQSTSIITRELILPSTKEKEMDKMIRFEIEQYLPISLDDYIVEYKILEEFMEENVNKSRIFIAGVPKKIVEGYLKLLKEMDLSPVALDLNSNSVAKLFTSKKEKEQNDNSDKTIAVIDIGYNYINLNIISKEITQFSRLINFGGRDIDISIANSSNLSLEEAEEKKINSIDLNNEIYSSESADILNNIARLAIDNCLEDVRRIFQYYISRTTGNKIDYIYIYGGSSRIVGLSDYIASYLNIQTYKVNKINKIILKKKVKDIDIDIYLNSIGALLRK